MFWAWMKQKARLHCDYSFPRLLEEVPALLGNYSIASIRRHVRRCLRFIDAYRRFSQEGMVGPLLSDAMKKFHSHRIPGDFVYNELVAEHERGGRNNDNNGNDANNNVV